MSDKARFENLLTSAPTVSLNGKLTRVLPLDWLAKYSPPDFLFTSGKPNRYNPTGVECIYFSENERTALSEYQRFWGGIPGRDQPRATYFARVRLRQVLDLMDRQTLSEFRLSTSDLHRVWRTSTDLTATQKLGLAISQQRRISAIRYPSHAAHDAGNQGANLVIFKENVRKPDRVEILGPAGRILQSWPLQSEA